MITAITQFKLPNPITIEEAQKIFESTAPNYLGKKGLFRKTYLYADDGVTVGGVYLWESKEDAEAMYTPEWFEFVRGKYGTEAIVTYFESPVVVDNVTNKIITA